MSEELTPKQEALKELNFKPQCFIVDLLPYFTALPFKSFPKGQGIYTAHDSIITLPPSREEGYHGDQAFIDKITAPLMESDLLSRVPKELMSSLQPYVKLYKVVYKSEHDKEGIDLRLPFNNFLDPAKFSASPATPLQKTYEGLVPGHLVAGLKEFTFDFIGTNPAAADVFIDCNLRIYFSSVDALFHEYKANKSIIEKHKLTDDQATYSFVDLIKRPKKFVTSKDGHKMFNHEHFRIKIEVGYEVPSEDYLNEILKKSFAVTGGTRTLDQEKRRIKNALKKSRLTLFLNLMRHEFQFNTEIPSGPFEITFTYNGAVESALVADEMDILRPEYDCESTAEAVTAPNMKEVKEIEERIKAADGLGPDALKVLQMNPSDKFFDVIVLAGEPATPAQYRPGHDRRSWKRPHGFDRGKISLRQRAESKKPTQHQFWKDNLGFYPPGYGAGQAENYKLPGTNHDYKEVAFTGKVALVFRYYAAKQRLALTKSNEGITDADVRAKAYTRIIRNLMHSRVIGGANITKIYNVSFPTVDLENWLKYKADAKYTKEELRKLRQAESAGSTKSRETISTIKADRKERVQEVGNQRAQFIKKLSGGSVVGANINREDTADLKEKTRDRVNGKNEDGETVSTGGNPWNELGVGSSAAPGENFDLKFFFFGDLVDEALRILTEIHGNLHPNLHINLWNKKNSRKLKKNKLHVVMGNFEYVDTFTKEKKTINIADFPISFSAFVEYWNNKVINKLKEKYLFKQFVVDAIKELVLKPLKTGCRWIDSDNPGLQPFVDYITIPPTAFDMGITTVSLSRADRVAAQADAAHQAVEALAKAAGTGTHYANQIDIPMGGRYFPNMAGPVAKNSGLENQVMIISLETRDPSYLANDKEKDMKNGVLYLPMGREGTPLLSIDFERIDQPYIMEARAEKGLLADVTQLSEVYDCNFKTYGNMSVRTGKRVYVSVPHFGDINSDLKTLRKTAFKNPAGFQKLLETDPSVITQFSRSRLLGLGGYYLITKTQHRVGVEGNRLAWSTEAKMRWDSFGETPERAVNKFTKEEGYKMKLSGQTLIDIAKQAAEREGIDL